MLPIYDLNSETNQGPLDDGLLPSTSQNSMLDFAAISPLTETRERNNERPRCDHIIKDCVNRGKWQGDYCNSAEHFKLSIQQHISAAQKCDFIFAILSAAFLNGKSFPCKH